MTQETDIKIGLSFLDEYEQEFKNRIGDYIAIREPIRLVAELGGPFNDTAAHFGMWKVDMEEKLKLAEQKLKESNEGLARIYFLRALHEAVLSSSSTGKRRNIIIEYYNKALELGFKPESEIYYRMGVTHQVLEGKREDVILCYEKVVELEGVDSSLGMECAKELEKLKTQKSGGCFIATAVYGSYNAPEVLVLRAFRDKFLLESKIGNLFVSLYYLFSPHIVKLVSPSSLLKNTVRNSILNPIVKYCSIKLKKI